MCGRYTLTANLFRIQTSFSVDLVDPIAWKARYNIAPTQDVPVILTEEDGRRHLTMMRWGLIPSWAKDESIGNKMINARAETLETKPAFRKAFRERRCLIPTDGFYEWKKSGSRKLPLRIQVSEGKPFGLAGLWESWRSPEKELIHSFTIVTTDANPFLRSIHNRMPVVLDEQRARIWLDPKITNPAVLRNCLTPYPGQMRADPVSTMVNSPKNDRPECIEPLQEELELKLK